MQKYHSKYAIRAGLKVWDVDRLIYLFEHQSTLHKEVKRIEAMIAKLERKMLEALNKVPE